MPRFTRGARVVFVEEKTTGRIGTIVEILPRPKGDEDFDQYQVEFPDGEIKTISDLELAPAGTDPTIENIP